MTHRSGLSSLPLQALRAFEAASRLGSFKAAAADLLVTPAAISHQVKALETKLGITLFERLHRELRITPSGARLGEICHSAFSSLEQVLDELVDDGLATGARTLSVTAAPSFAGKWLVPRLRRFQALHPNVELRLVGGDALVDLTNRREVDIALRYGRGPYGKALHAERLWPAGKIVAVCAPGVAGSPELRKPRDVLNFPLLRTASPRPSPEHSGHARDSGWLAWLKAANVTGAAAERAAAMGPLFGSSQLTLEAAAGGQGIALAPLALVAEDVRSGRLIRPFETAITDPCYYWLLFRKDRADEARIRAFAQWIVREAEATETMA